MTIPFRNDPFGTASSVATAHVLLADLRHVAKTLEVQLADEVGRARVQYKGFDLDECEPALPCAWGRALTRVSAEAIASDLRRCAWPNDLCVQLSWLGTGGYAMQKMSLDAVSLRRRAVQCRPLAETMKDSYSNMAWNLSEPQTR
jgi:hypothetical protein